MLITLELTTHKCTAPKCIIQFYTSVASPFRNWFFLKKQRKCNNVPSLPCSRNQPGNENVSCFTWNKSSSIFLLWKAENRFPLNRVRGERGTVSTAGNLHILIHPVNILNLRGLAFFFFFSLNIFPTEADKVNAHSQLLVQMKI